MKKLLSLFSVSLALAVMAACSTKVDLYDDYQDIAIVYGLLDHKLDTNFIRIQKAFLGYGDATEIAQIPDSSNYSEKLDAKLIEVLTNKELPLDTITVYAKESGVFYGGGQLVYYTTEEIKPQSRYKLVVTKPDGTLVTATTGIVGGESFKISTGGSFNFSSTASKASVSWSPAANAALYEVLLSFVWEEGGQEERLKMPLGTYKTSDIVTDHGLMKLTFSPELFFNSLKTYLGSDTTNGAERTFKNKCVFISVSAGGSELATYIEANSPSTSIAQSTLDWTNVTNGYGVLSSRVNIQDSVSLSARTVQELMAKGWGFFKID